MSNPTNKEERTPKQIHNLIVEIWGRDKTKRGYCIIEATLSKDTRLEGMNQEMLSKIYTCLLSIKEKNVCPIHGKIHNYKTK